MGLESNLSFVSDLGEQTTASVDEAELNVKNWDLLAFFWDHLTDEEKAAINAAASEPPPADYDEASDPLRSDDNSPVLYCAGINAATVNPNEVEVKVWYWHETESNATALTIANGVATQSISDADWQDVWGQNSSDKPAYDERGGVLSKLNGDFYSMSEEAQYFYVKIIVASTGVLDNVDNPFDADPSTAERETSIRYKLKIDADGNVSLLEVVYA